MPRFQFAFENILKIKEKMEEQKKSELGVLVQRQLGQQERIEITEGKCQNNLRTLKEVQSKKLQIGEIKRYQQADKFYRRKLSEERWQLEVLNGQVEQKREEVTGVMQERKTYEKLKEKALWEYQQEAKKQEAKRVDELVSYRYGQ